MPVTVTVEWGYEEHSLTLTDKEWSTIKNGDLLLIKGEGYHYEGEFFQDYWKFGGGLDGSLVVTYCVDGGGDIDAGTGFDGSLADATIQE